MLYATTLLHAALASSVCAVDVKLFFLNNCALTAGRDLYCLNHPANVCCSENELSPPTLFSSTRAAKPPRTIRDFTVQADAANEFNVPVGTSDGCFDEGGMLGRIISGSQWLTPAALKHTKRMSDVAARSAEDPPSALCLGRRAPTHYFADIDGKTYLIERSTFDRAAFDKLETGAEKYEFFRQHADIVKEQTLDSNDGDKAASEEPKK